MVYVFIGKNSIPVKFTDKSSDKIKIRILILPRLAGVDNGFQYYAILVQCHISIPPENVKKPMVFWRFQGI